MVIGSRAIRVLRVLVVVVAILPPAAYLYLGQTCAIDAPLLDDYDAILDFTSDLRESQSFGDRVRLFFEPHNEHVIAFTRLASVVLQSIQGHLDFRMLSLLGNLGLVGVGLLLCYAGCRGGTPKLPLLVVLPVSFLLFQPQAFDVLHWPTASIAGNFVVVFGLLTFLFLERKSTAGTVLAIASAALAVCTQANGAAVPLVVLVVLVLNSRWRTAIPWCGVSLVVLLLTFARGMPAPADATDGVGWFTGVPYFLNFVGTAPQAVLPGLGLPVAVSICLCVVLFVRRRLYAEAPFVFGALLFLLTSILMNTLSRWQFGADYPGTQPRYGVYSVLVLSLCHLALSHIVRNHRLRWTYHGAAIALSIVFCVASFATYTPRLRAEARLIGRGLAYWSVTGDSALRAPSSGTYKFLRGSTARSWSSSTLAYPDQASAARILRRARDHGIYAPGAAGLARVLDRPVEREASDTSEWLSMQVVLTQRSDEFLIVEGRYHARQEGALRSAAHLVLAQAGQAHAAFTVEPLYGDDAEQDVPFRCIVPDELAPETIDRIGVLPAPR